MNEDLLSFYGARPSKNGNGYNITLIKGKDGKKAFENVFAKNERCREKDGFVYVKIKLLEPKKEEQIDELPF